MPTIRSNGAALYYEAHGDASHPAIVLAHGMGGNTLSWWQQIQAFARDYRVVVFDHRGFAPDGHAVPTDMRDLERVRLKPDTTAACAVINAFARVRVLPDRP